MGCPSACSLTDVILGPVQRHFGLKIQKTCLFHTTLSPFSFLGPRILHSLHPWWVSENGRRNPRQDGLARVWVQPLTPTSPLTATIRPHLSPSVLATEPFPVSARLVPQRLSLAVTKTEVGLMSPATASHQLHPGRTRYLILEFITASRFGRKSLGIGYQKSCASRVRMSRIRPPSHRREVRPSFFPALSSNLGLRE